MNTQIGIMKEDKSEKIDDYISKFPIEIQELLKTIRITIKDSVPEAIESISYGMPSFKIKENSIWFAAYKKHIGFYPIYGMEQYKEEMNFYRAKGKKSTLHFYYNRELPVELIAKIVKFKFYKEKT